MALVTRTVTTSIDDADRTFDLRVSNGRLYVTHVGYRDHAGYVTLATGAWTPNKVSGRLSSQCAGINWISLYNASAPAAPVAATTMSTPRRSEFCRRCGSYCYGDCQERY